MFATALQVLHPHIVLHVSISRVNTIPVLPTHCCILTCISAYEHKAETLDRV